MDWDDLEYSVTVAWVLRGLFYVLVAVVAAAVGLYLIGG